VAVLGVLDWAPRTLVPAGPNAAPISLRSWKTSTDVTALSFGSDRKPVVLVLDHGPIHTSKATRRAHWLTIELPSKYTPERNDIEAVWRDLKRHHLASIKPSPMSIISTAPSTKP
jgi:hypothetical protein